MKFPTGTIIIWSGGTIPEGWVLCNGSNGTPNLTNKFVLGATQDSDLLTAGGSTSHSHTNSGTTGSNGAHTHSGVTVSTGNSGSSKYYGGSDTSGAGNHNHGNVTLTPSSGGEHTHSVNVATNADANTSMPPYKIFQFIMKVD